MCSGSQHICSARALCTRAGCACRLHFSTGQERHFPKAALTVHLMPCRHRCRPPTVPAGSSLAPAMFDRAQGRGM